MPRKPRATYLEAAHAFADLVAQLPPSLEGPGLGEWDLRALVGHTARSLVTVSDYLRRPAPSVVVGSAAEYVAGLGAASQDPAVTRRGVEAGQMLGDDPAGAVRLLLDSVTADLARADLDQVVTTYAGGMRLREYLPTRTFELVVHGLDIAHAVPLPWTPPAAALRTTVRIAADVAVLRGEGPLLLRLVTGREPGGVAIV
ncbi:mycothiol maleylpyruvate isomerase [Nocardioides anomalus]|uniref:Mycothiol maleylpyruvate isomerase n=1 Tax=Nocardioides anomalus TaxID=2712223 RepID=A0A6G6W9S3_9ACTN|nr:maleylpyruvate isomerase N-terminal domain-containing protein [Nocardioides anomalus]QIG41972.1 mycothiol maleylpyruvate isomerase [Nocardioides anomalus]